MSNMTKIVALVFLITCGASFAQEQSGAAAASSKPKSSTAMRSTVANRQSVEVTIYNSDLGLIKERRKIKLPAGEGELQFADVAAAINPVTVHVKPLSNASDFSILEQNYEYDLISHAKLMDKYVGKKIKIVDWNEYQDRKTTVEAELVSMNAGEVYRIDKEIYLGHPGTKVLPELPGNLISRPTLSWIYKNKTAREYQLEVSYLTSGMTWNADYILAVADGKPASLSGWVTVNNMSGAAYENAKLNLVAGNVNRVRQEFGGARMNKTAMVSEAAMMDRAAGFGQSEVFEYHIYDLQRPTTIKENQTKQISLLEAHGVNVTREYITMSAQGIFMRGGSGGTEPAIKQPVNVYFTFKNAKENKLGNPLPAGIVRMYTDDAKGSRQFIGEDRIAHTPKDEEIRLKAGEAFDIVAERTQVSFKQITSKQSEVEFEIAVRNRKNEDISVRVQETAHGNWSIVQSSHKHLKTDANTFRFDVPVGKGQEVKVKYKIRMGV